MTALPGTASAINVHLVCWLGVIYTLEYDVLDGIKQGSCFNFRGLVSFNISCIILWTKISLSGEEIGHRMLSCNQALQCGKW